MTPQRGPTPAPFFSLADGAWIPYAWTWDPETGDCIATSGERPSFEASSAVWQMCFGTGR
jgi:hypothetical protein